MIPTTITGILVLLVLLLPGFVFASTRERHQPSRKPSALRETGLVVAAASVAYVPSAVIFVIAAVLYEHVRADLALFIGIPEAFVAAHPFRFAIAFFVSVIGACAVAALLGSRRMVGLVPGSGGSAWWRMFSADAVAGASVEVTVTLVDDTIITGTLHSWNADEDEHADRDIVLRAPLWIQPAGVDEVHDLGSETVAISARQIRMLGTSYVAAMTSDQTS